MGLNQLFIHNLKRWRKTKGLSQKKLAEKCGTGHSYIRQIESGNRSPSFAFIGKIANALQIEPYLLFYDETGELGQSTREKYIESIQTKLLEAVCGDIQDAFNELKRS